MENQEAFAALVKREPGWLERPIEEMVKISAVGSVYISTHKAMLRKIKAGQIKLAEADRKTKLADGQAVGDALLDVEARIGELSLQEPQATSAAGLPGGGSTVSGQPPKHKRLGLPSENAMAKAQTIFHHPEVVAEVKREAKENEDIPTKTAVLNKIRADRERELREDYAKKVKKEKSENLASARGEAMIYLSKLREVVAILPVSVPKEGWGEPSFAEARAMVEIIRKRLEVWE